MQIVYAGIFMRYSTVYRFQFSHLLLYLVACLPKGSNPSFYVRHLIDVIKIWGSSALEPKAQWFGSGLGSRLECP